MARKATQPTYNPAFQDFRFDVSKIDFSGLPETARSQEGDGAEEPGLGTKILSGIGAFGEEMTRLPGAVWDTLTDTFHGGDIDVTDRERIEKWRERQKKDQEYIEKWNKRGAPEGFAEGMASMPYSFASLVASLGPRIGAAAIGGIGGSVVPGPGTFVGAGTAQDIAGMVTSGALAYRSQKENFLQRLLERAENLVGRQLTQEEWDNVAAEFDHEATQYGLAEAVPEALGNATVLNLLGVTGKPLFKAGLKKAIARYVGAQLSEQAQETATEMWQAPQEVAAGLRDKAPENIMEANDLVFWPTFWMTTATGGMMKGAQIAHNRMAGRNRQVSENADETQGQDVTPGNQPSEFANESETTEERDHAQRQSQEKQLQSGIYDPLLNEEVRRYLDLQPGLAQREQLPGVQDSQPEAPEYISGIGVEPANQSGMPAETGSLGANLDNGQTVDLLGGSETDMPNGHVGGQAEYTNDMLNEWADLLGLTPGEYNGGVGHAQGALGDINPEMLQGIDFGNGLTTDINPYRISPLERDYLHGLAGQGQNVQPQFALPPALPAQSQITNTQVEPRADTTAAADRLGLPMPPAIPQEAQPLQPAAATLPQLPQPAQPPQPALPQMAQGIAAEPAQPLALPAADQPVTQESNPGQFLDDHVLTGSVPAMPGGQSQEEAQQGQAEAQEEKPADKPRKKPNRAELINELPQADRARARRMKNRDLQELVDRRRREKAQKNKSGINWENTINWDRVDSMSPEEQQIVSDIFAGKREEKGKELGNRPQRSAEEILGDGLRAYANDAYLRNDLDMGGAIREAHDIINKNGLDLQGGENDIVRAAHNAIYDAVYDRMQAEAEKGGENLKERLKSIYDRLPGGMDGRAMEGLRKFINSAGREARAQETATNESAEARARRELPLVAEVESGVIKKTEDVSAIQAAVNWARVNIDSPARTEIGTIEVDARGVRDSLSHGFNQTKLDAVQAIVPVLERGKYLGELPDKDGKPIENHYFAGKVSIGGKEKIIFARARKRGIGKNRFYVHEVYTEDEIAEAGRAPRATDPDQSFHGVADFYKNLIANYLEVKAKISSSNEDIEKVESRGNKEQTNGEEKNQTIRRPAEHGLVDGPAEVDAGVEAGPGSGIVEQPESPGSAEASGHDGDRSLGGLPGHGRDARGRERGDDSGGAVSDRRGVSGGRNAGRAANEDSGVGGENNRGRGGRPGREDSGVLGERNRNNHRIEDGDVLVPGGAVARAKANIAAIKLVRKLEEEGRAATPEEKKILAQFTGWGSLAQTVFHPDFEDMAKRQARGAGLSSYYSDQEIAKYNKWVENYGKHLNPDLGGIMTKEEWEAAKKSTLNAHYTDRRVISAMWDMAQKLGFTGGRVLEPSAGTGLFFGLMPENISRNSQLAGVELDTMTGKILKALYPDADIQITGFENAKRLGDNSVDLAISNVPFGDFSVFDKKRPQYSKQSIHNYFFSRGIDAVRPGGLVAFITSHFTLDAASNSRLREEWAKKADLVGAIRLPGTAFEKNAGTQVTTDIIIFRKKSDSQFTLGQDFRNVGTVNTKEGEASVNEYFIAHPEMALGEHSLAGSMYGDKEYTLLPNRNESIEAGLQRAIAAFPANVYGAYSAGLARNDSMESHAAKDGSKEGSLVEDRDKVWLVNDGQLEEPEWINKRGKQEQAKSYLKVKDAALNLINAMNSEMDDKGVAELRKKLNEVYDSYEKKYGAINRKGNGFLEDDIEFPTVSALEEHSREPAVRTIKSGKHKGETRPYQKDVYSKAAIFNKRTIYPFHAPQTAENLDDAIKISRIYNNRVDLPYIASMLGMDIEEARSALLETGNIYENPATGLLETKDEYLSGNVRKKLEAAREAAQDNDAYKANVEALEAVQPEPLGIDQIHATIGSAWLPSDVLNGFLKHLGVSSARVVKTRVPGAEGSTSWSVEGYGFSGEASQRWSTRRATLTDLVEDCLNLKRTTIYDSIGDGKRERNEEETLAAQEKQRELQEEFARWLPGSEYAETIEKEYNDKFNGHVRRQFDVPQIRHYPGANQSIELRDNQKKGVARALQESCLLAHGVGSGKTMLQITLAMEMRRLGTAKKPWIVVQDSTLGQFAASFKNLYPGAKILVPSKKQRSAAKRQRLLAQIASGDWDAVITPHGFFNGVSMSPETEARFIQEQIDSFKETLRGVEKNDQRTRKQIEKAIDKFRTRLEALADIKKDQNIYFDQLGIDALIIDEAHTYKRGQFVTKMGNVKGLDRDSSQRSLQLLMKARMVQARTGGKNVVLATGTPISNTLTEMWTMFRYVRPDLLEEFGVEQFDDFATTFASTSVTQEETATGEWKDVERFNKYVNGPELLTLWSLGADVAITEDLDGIKDLPKIKGGKIQEVAIERTPELGNYIEALRQERAEWDNLPVSQRNSGVPLTIYTRAKKAAIDLRLVDSTLPDSPNSKVNKAVENIFERWSGNADSAAAQIVFCDSYQSGDKKFNIFRDIKEKLVRLGIPAEEVAIIHDYKTDEARAKLFQEVNDGDVRVLMGTTEKLGVGVNVQERLLTAHHLDAPQRPMDFEQRNGRIRRPGNMFKEVEILTYGTKNTLDSVTFQQLINKQKFINQLMRGNVTDRSFENPFDESQATFQEMMAAFSGNPLVKEKMQLTEEVRKLNNQRSAHEGQLTGLRRELKSLKSYLANQEKAQPEKEKLSAFIKEHFAGGKLENKKELAKDIGEWLKDNEKAVLDSIKPFATKAQWQIQDPAKFRKTREINIGHGVKLKLTVSPYVDSKNGEGAIQLEHDTHTTFEVTGPHGLSIRDSFNGAQGLFTRLGNRLAYTEQTGEIGKAEIARTREKIEATEKELQRPFTHQEALDKARARLEEVEKELAQTSQKETDLSEMTPDGPLASLRGKVNSYGISMDHVAIIDREFTREESRTILEGLAGQDLPNLLAGLTAQVNRNQRDKLVSGKAADKSVANNFSRGEHYSLAAQIAKAWEWAAEIEQEANRNPNAQNVNFRKFVASARIRGKDGFILLTVSETAKEGLKIYSAELLNEKQLRNYAGTYDKNSQRYPIRSVEETIAALAGEVNDTSAPGASIQAGEFLPARKQRRIRLSAAVVKGIAGKLGNRARNAAPVQVVQSFEELPARLRERFARDSSNLEGVFDPATGKVWLVADNISDTTRACEVWAHEQLVHNGLRGLFTDSERRSILNQLWLSLGGMGNPIVRRIAEGYGLNPRGKLADRLIVMEETLASLAEGRQKGLADERTETMWRKVVRAVLRAWNALVEKITGRQASMGMKEVDRLLSALGRYVFDGIPAGQSRGQMAAGALASVGKSAVNSYGIPMERVTRIEGNVTTQEAQSALEKLGGIDLPNYLEGVTAQVNRTQRKKMTSPTAREKSIKNGFTGGEHNSLAAKVANAWKWSAEARGIGGSKNASPDVEIRRFVAALEINGKTSFGWLTAKESNGGLRLYTVELLTEEELKEKLKGISKKVDGDKKSSAISDDERQFTTPHLARSYEKILNRLKAPVNEGKTPLASLANQEKSEKQKAREEILKKRRELNNLILDWRDYTGASLEDLRGKIKKYFELESLADLPSDWIEDAQKFVKEQIEIAKSIPHPEKKGFLDKLLNMGARQAAHLAENEPEVSRAIRPQDLTGLQTLVQLPHWIAKQFSDFGKLYERQIKRADERSANVTKSLEEVPSLFGKNTLGKEDKESLRQLIWKLEGKKTLTERKSNVEKFLVDGQYENGRDKLKINPDFYDVYQKALDNEKATDAAKKAMMEIRKSLDNDLLTAYNRMAEMVDVHDDAIKELRDEISHIPNYFPHHRYGKYYVQAVKNGDVLHRTHFDALNDRLAERKAREIAAKYKDEYPGAKWKWEVNSKMPEEALGAPIDTEAMTQIIKAATSKIDNEEQRAEIKELLLRGTADVLKSRGWGSHGIQRQDIPGHETEDIVRILFDYKSGLHGWLTKMDAARDFSRILGEIDARRQPKLWAYSKQYVQDMLRNADSIDRTVGKIKSVAFAWYLGMNIKTAFVNATQNLIVGVPRLQMDVTGGGRLWLKGAADALENEVTGRKGKGLTAEEQRLIQELYGQKVITAAFMSEARGHMEGFRGAKIWNKFTEILGMPMSMVEKFNRASLALAAYRAATRGAMKEAAKKKYGIVDKATYEQALKFAMDVVRDAHFVYGKSNMPEFMRSNAAGRMGSAMYTFRTFSHNMLAMWLWALKTQGKEGAMFTAKSLGATMALGGVTALPLYATLMALFQLASGDDDDWTEMIRNSLPNDNLLRDVVCYGMPAIGGVSIGGSLKMETPVTRSLSKGVMAPDELLKNSIGEIIGIPYDLLGRLPKAAEAMDKGNYFRALEEAVPTFVKNGLQAWRLYTEGQTTMAGSPINSPGQQGARKLSGSEAIGKALGFQPVSNTKSYESYAAEKRREAVRNNMLNELTVLALKTADSGKPEGRLKAIQKMRAWNERMKKEGKEGMLINWKQVMKRVKARRRQNSMSAEQREKGRRQMETWGI